MATARKKMHFPLKVALPMIWNYVKSKLKEQIKAVSFIIIYLVAFKLIVLQSAPENALQVAFGVGMVVLGLAMFLESYMLWAGNSSPNNIGLTILGYLYKRGIEKNDMGYACAVGVVLLIVALIINFAQLILNGTFKKEEQ